ncbi:MAG: Sec-independent protein translocase protein TatB [Cypionkella sp.]|nr:Sec-independent protein translocase protein TatB [Cypionkella sp.]
MFDLGMSELLVIGIVALIVIGPKDLPGLFRSLGRFTGKMRSMAREFSRAMEAAADETGVKDVAKDLKDVTSVRSMGLDKVREAADRFEKWDPMKPSVRSSSSVGTAAHATAPSDDKPRGPATTALAEQAAARKAAAEEAAEKLRRASAPLASDAAADPSPEPPKA